MRPGTFNTPVRENGPETSYAAARLSSHCGVEPSADLTPSNPDRITATINVVARITGFSRSEIYRLLTAGDLKAVKRGRKTLILMGSVTGYVASLPPAQFGGSAR